MVMTEQKSECFALPIASEWEAITATRLIHGNLNTRLTKIVTYLKDKLCIPTKHKVVLVILFSKPYLYHNSLPHNEHSTGIGCTVVDEE